MKDSNKSTDRISVLSKGHLQKLCPMFLKKQNFPRDNKISSGVQNIQP